MRILFTLMLLLATTGTTLAQTPETAAEVESLLQKERKSVDVEVLRRLLNQRFGFADQVEFQLPAPTSWVPQLHNPTLATNSYQMPWVNRSLDTPSIAWTQNYKHSGDTPLNAWRQNYKHSGPQLSQAIGPFDGTALPGGGIVYTLHIPAGVELTFDAKTNVVGLGNNCANCHMPVPSNAARFSCPVKGQATATNCTTCHEGGTVKGVQDVAPLSDWERVKRQVGVEKVESISKPTTKLKPERSPMCQPGDIAEQIIQVLAANTKNLGQLVKTERVTVVLTFDELPTVKVEFGSSFRPEETQAFNLGKLHLKQQKYKEAAESFEKGLARFQTGVIRMSIPEGTQKEDLRKLVTDAETTVRTTFGQLALAYFETSEPGKAKAALERALNFKIDDSPHPRDDKPKPKLPAKLIVSVLKAEIDSAKTLDDFRKVAMVERSGFPALKK